MRKFPFYKQSNEMDCGPACLKMIIKHYGQRLSAERLGELSKTTRLGSSLSGISEAAEKLGFRTKALKITFETLIKDAPLPCIAHWNQKHFVIVYSVKKKQIHVADPGHGLITYEHSEFIKSWQSSLNEGIVLLLEPTQDFYTNSEFLGIDAKGLPNRPRSLSFLFGYLVRYKKLVIQLVIGLIVSSILQLIFPFLTQSIVDIGIQNNNINFIYLILFAQLMLFLGRTTIEIIRSWILMHISSRVNISLISDFFVKLMKLPISFFDLKMTGDIMQRINDHRRIETLLTSTSLNVVFSFLNLLIFSGILAYYDWTIFWVFVLGSLIYFAWISFFLKKRAEIDFKRFNQNSLNQSKIIELINGMQDIKLHNAERQKRWQWEDLQVRLFNINIKGLILDQVQGGASLINELKNIVITVLAAKSVIDGHITLGMMLSISYIIGQLNSPIGQLVGFMQGLQDARLSLDRISEIHNKSDEETDMEASIDLVEGSSIVLKEVSFSYVGTDKAVLSNLNLTIPANKITSIVGVSGSGKTTLMKLMLRFYLPSQGGISVGAQRLNSVNSKSWRDVCGVVMQEGYIFSDTIAKNIALGFENIDTTKLMRATRIANIDEYIDSLPLGYNTKIGMEGLGLSSGQKQRILIARAVYKDPRYLFFDEATSALDANNEKVIMTNLQQFFRGRTVVIIAHRLSTVKNSDQIIVINNGRAIETGNHKSLTISRGSYYELVKNQLELGE